MRELATTHWMHNRARMVAASFLTKDLHVHWTRGRALVRARARRRRPRQQQRRLAVGGGLRHGRRAVLPDLQPGAPVEEVRSRRRLHPPLRSRALPRARRKDPRAVDPDRRRAARRRLSHRRGLPRSHRGSRPRARSRPGNARRATLGLQLATQIVSRPKGGRRFASREPERSEGSAGRSSPHPGEPAGGAPRRGADLERSEGSGKKRRPRLILCRGREGRYRVLALTTGSRARLFPDPDVLKDKDLAVQDLEARGARRPRPGAAPGALRAPSSASASSVGSSSATSCATAGRTRTRTVSPAEKRLGGDSSARRRSSATVTSVLTRPLPEQAGQARVSTRSRLPRERCRVISIRPNSEICSTRVRARSRASSSSNRSKSFAAVLGVLHVDEVHDEQTAEVAQPDLAGHLRRPPRGSSRRPCPRGPPCRRTGPCSRRSRRGPPSGGSRSTRPRPGSRGSSARSRSPSRRRSASKSGSGPRCSSRRRASGGSHRLEELAEAVVRGLVVHPDRVAVVAGRGRARPAARGRAPGAAAPAATSSRGGARCARRAPPGSGGPAARSSADLPSAAVRAMKPPSPPKPFEDQRAGARARASSDDPARDARPRGRPAGRRACGPPARSPAVTRGPLPPSGSFVTWTTISWPSLTRSSIRGRSAGSGLRRARPRPPRRNRRPPRAPRRPRRRGTRRGRVRSTRTRPACREARGARGRGTRCRRDPAGRAARAAPPRPARPRSARRASREVSR